MGSLLPNQMETEQPASVMASLMGIDELPPRLSLRKQRKVLSDSYIQKVASICIREGSSIRRKYNTNSEMSHGVNTVSGVQISRNGQVELNKHSNSSTRKINVRIRSQEQANASVLKSLPAANYGNVKLLCNEVAGNVLRYIQKLDNDSYAAAHFGDLGHDCTNKIPKLNLDRLDRTGHIPTSIYVSRPKSEKLIHGIGDKKVDYGHSRSEYRKQGENTVDVVLGLRRGCIICDQNMNINSQKGKYSSKPKDISRYGCKEDSNPQKAIEALVLSSHDEYKGKNHNYAQHDFVDHSSLFSEANEETFERKKTAENVEGIVVSMDKDSLPGNLNLKLDTNGCEAKQDESTEIDDQPKMQNNSRKDFVEPREELSSDHWQSFPCVKDTIPQTSNIFESSGSGFSSLDSEMEPGPESSVQSLQDELDNYYESYECRKVELSLKVAKSSIINTASQSTVDKTLADVCFGISEDQQSKSNPANWPVVGGHTSFVPEVFSGQVSLSESSVPVTYSHCSQIYRSDFLDDLNGTNQRSPDSVLVPFYSQHSIIKNSETLQFLLEAFNSESGETYSEGSVIVVSGDEDFEDEFSSTSHDSTKVEEWFEDDESRNFSYLVDVLEEGGFCGVESFMDFNSWYSLELPISPFVFDSLEKKYGKQTSWQRSERHLLFDRINSELSDILSPLRNFYASSTSIRRRFSASWRRDEVEDEIWMMLVCQEKEKFIDLSKKVMSGATKWLEYEEDVNIICEEIEASLLDELVMEFCVDCGIDE